MGKAERTISFQRNTMRNAFSATSRTESPSTSRGELSVGFNTPSWYGSIRICFFSFSEIDDLTVSL